MIIDRVDMGSATVLRLEGDIDEQGVKELRAFLLGCIKEGRHNLIVNLRDVKYISYMGVGVLVERLRQCRLFNGDMKLTGMNLYSQRLFRMVGVTSVFDTYESENQAVQVFQEAA